MPIKRKRKKKEKWYALKFGSIDGKKRIEKSYDKLKKYFAPNVIRPIHKSFNNYMEAYCWLYDKPLPAKKRPSEALPLF